MIKIIKENLLFVCGDKLYEGSPEVLTKRALTCESPIEAPYYSGIKWFFKYLEKKYSEFKGMKIGCLLLYSGILTVIKFSIKNLKFEFSQLEIFILDT